MRTFTAARLAIVVAAVGAYVFARDLLPSVVGLGLLGSVGLTWAENRQQRHADH